MNPKIINALSAIAILSAAPTFAATLNASGQKDSTHRAAQAASPRHMNGPSYLN